MKKTDDPKPQYARLPNGHKVKIVSQDDQTATVERLGGRDRKGTLAVCAVGKLRPV